VNRVAVITGASSGIGRASALALAADGFTVVAAGRRQDRLAELVDEIGDGLALVCDVRDEASVRSLFARTVEAFGRVDVLFNNAGIFPRSAPIEDVTFDDWTQAVATNLSGAFLCLREAFRVMKDQRPSGGRIINNGSISAHTPRLNALAYTATKHAITGLTKSTALEGRRYGIACGQLDIGNAATSMTSGEFLQADGTMRTETTMDVSEAARAVAYLASLPPEANVPFMTVMATGMPYFGRG
jgi:NAD(P)-dependent dehydrogenase (short-subunit alcohol dehydrogenase family)